MLQRKNDEGDFRFLIGNDTSEKKHVESNEGKKMINLLYTAKIAFKRERHTKSQNNLLLANQNYKKH